MGKEIRLYNRYHDDNRLVQIGDESSKIYKLVTESEYYRCGLIEGNPKELSFIDPAGGPFITKGTNISNNIVKTIYADGTIEFE